ncbi:MAG: hypothetical protein ACFE0P_05795 [Oceanicaulis sp.]
MTQLQALAVLAIRLMAIWLLVFASVQLIGYAITSIHLATHELDAQGMGAFALGIAASAAVAATLPVLFLCFARRLARLLIPANAPEIQGLEIDTQQLARLAMAIIGLHLIATGLPDAAGAAVRQAAQTINALANPSSIPVSMGVIPGLPEHLAKTVLGLALFLTAFRISPFLRPLRKAGTGAHLQEPTSPSQSTERS